MRGLSTCLVEDVAERSSNSEDIGGPQRVFVKQFFVRKVSSRFLGVSFSPMDELDRLLS